MGLDMIKYFDTAFSIYYWLLFLRIIMSWFRLPANKIFQHIWNFIYDLTEPVLALFRRIMPSVMVGAVGVDFSPIIAFIVLRFAYWSIIRPILIAIFSSF